MTQESQILSFLAFLNRQSDAGRVDLSILRDTPVARWSELFVAPGASRSYGAVRSMLAYAREQFDRDPGLAVAITRYVTDRIDEIEPVGESVIIEPFIRGLAWKEHANALYGAGEVTEAAGAAEKAIAVFSASPVFESDLASANLVRAMSLHALGSTGDALQLAVASLRLFGAHADPAMYLVAVQVCGGLLFDLEEYSSALDAYRVALSVAEELTNQREYARMLNNLGTCNVCLNNMEIAERQLQQAFRLFQQQGMESEMLRTVTALARITSLQGNVDRALDACHSIYADLLYHGLTLSAAQVLVELMAVMTEMTGKPEYARNEGSRLAAALGEEENVPANLRAAMVFLVQRTVGARTTSQLGAAISHVKTFLRDVMFSPVKEFVTPI